MGMKIIGTVTDICQIDIEKEAITKIQASEINTKDFLYIKGRILTVDTPNLNGDYFPEESVKESYETFCGGIIDIEHEQDKVIGRILDAVFFPTVGDKLGYVEIIGKINKKCDYPDFIKKVESGEIATMSLEAYANEMECSICGHVFDYVEQKPCKHIESSFNKMITAEDGSQKHVFRKDRKLTMTGLGIVAHPADTNADIYTVMANKNETKISENKIDLNEALKKLNAAEFIEILKAVENKWSGKSNKISMEIMSEIKDKVMTEPEFYSYISAKYNRLNNIEIEQIKKDLKANNKLIDNIYGAYILNSKEGKYWVVTVNGKQEIKKNVKDIWAEDWNKGVEIEGKKLEEYAVSNEFKKNMLMIVQTKGINQLKSSWEINAEDNELKEKIKKLAFIFDTGYYLTHTNAEGQALALTDRAYQIAIDNKGSEYNKLIEWRDNHYEHGTDRYDIMTNIASLFKPTTNKLDEIKAFAKMLNVNITGEQIVDIMFGHNGNNIEAASKTLYVKDKFCECLKENENNDNIKLKGSQNKQDAVESFCYNKIVDKSITASNRNNNNEKIESFMFNKIIGGYNKCVEKYDVGMCAWLEGKVNNEITGMSKKVLAKDWELKNNINGYKNNLTHQYSYGDYPMDDEQLEKYFDEVYVPMIEKSNKSEEGKRKIANDILKMLRNAVKEKYSQKEIDEYVENIMKIHN